MEDLTRHIFGFIMLVIFSKATAQNLSLLPTISFAQTCTASDGTTYNVGDEWMPTPFNLCRCVAPLSIQCTLIFRCADNHGNTKNPGDQWLQSPTISCTCNQGNLVACTTLKQPVCMDGNGNFRKDKETWTNGSCVHCTCILGSINCTGYHVNITHGLYSVNSYPTCEGCEVMSRTQGALSSCRAYHDLSTKEKLFQCASRGSFIHKSHQCNRIYECPDKSDENDCENGILLRRFFTNLFSYFNKLLQLPLSDCSVCRDNEGGVYLIKDKNGWPVSQCMKCYCKGGLLTCSRHFKINFPGYLSGIYTHHEDCNQPLCNVAKFIRENGNDCEGLEFIQNKGVYLKGQTWKSDGCQFYFPGANADPLNICPAMTRPDCYVYNGAVCCASECPVLPQIAHQLRANLTLCRSGRQLVSDGLNCNDAGHCLKNFHVQNCSSGITCRDEDSIQYFEGATWSVGSCIQCSCTQGKIRCKRELLLVSFLQLGVFLCESGDEIRSLGDRCDVKKDCNDHSDERNCSQSNLNDTNFLNVSNDLATAAENGDFMNIRLFHDLFKDLFYNVTRLLTPLTLQNADKALQYCKNFIQTLLSSPIYGQKSSFCLKPKLAHDRNFHINRALEFLRQAPNNTDAFEYGQKGFYPVKDIGYSSEAHIVDNFRIIVPDLHPIIMRQELSLQLNTAKLLPREVEKPISVPVDKSNTTGNVTTANGTRANTTGASIENVNNELTDEEIRHLLRANNCTNLTFDEEIGAVVYNKRISNEYQRHIEIQTNMELVLMCISTAAVLLALILLTALKLKSSERLFIHKSLLLSLALGHLVYIMDKTLFDTREKHAALCSALTAIQYFFHTAIFTWMLVEGINLYIKLVKVFSVKKQYVAYVAMGWGIPIVLMGFVAAISPSTFDMRKASYTDVSCGALQLTAKNERRRCWINGSVWIYKGPILGILMANTVLFAILLRVIFGKISTRYGNDHMQATKKGIRSIVALLPLLGVTWLLGFFGIVFFIFHCVLDEEVGKIKA
ncbi:uncharacterized protein LOC113684043 [Pocillopora damicornis]|uniref:uncharacterized protein LOC113684043 n=1 Tax=Pocillopora damicornis TaxID=46731 RepID=UPI000F551F0C|nr:uncharacterized protein LOC113684043 [Pocillopora damicornis]